MKTATISIPPLDRSLEAALRAAIDGKAKPPGSLGRVEDIAVQLGLVRGTLTPRTDRALLMVFAGDHGLVEDGVSRYPSSVTAAMVDTFLKGKATANAFAQAVHADLKVINAGVAVPIPAHPRLIDAAIRCGTRNAAREAALTAAEVEEGLARGAGIARDAARAGYDVLALGEMGIGNTASAALIMHRLAGVALDDCVGRGAGHDDAGLARKKEILARAAARTSANDPRDVLTEFGGCEIVMMAGAILGAAASARPVIVDGFIATAAALAAIRIAPTARDYCLFAHRSAEAGHSRMLAAIGARPLLELEMRLGEGTGALLAVPIVRSAARLLTDVASLDEVLSGNI